jgi:hypothetical protein
MIARWSIACELVVTVVKTAQASRSDRPGGFSLDRYDMTAHSFNFVNSLLVITPSDPMLYDRLWHDNRNTLVSYLRFTEAE